jgi:hypothetical protein
MNKTQIFILLVISGLIILALVSYYLLIELRATMREKAKYEAISHGLQEAKGFLGQFRQQ